MTINAKTLLGMPVETESGKPLGKVHSFEFDPLSHTIIQYEIRPHSLIKGILAENLLIHHNQVIGITKTKMIVDDLVASEAEKASGVSRAPAASS
ncbi:MAG: PRC-barrel domain-containing protein [Candidatus Kerfeldbacteria bacterium]|nr:PRC-barrel domain-containing protein [Candidatus Kerfeldbacteria bacterium]